MFPWSYWLNRGRKGDEVASRVALDLLASGLRSNTLDDEQRAFLADGLQLLARAVTPKEKSAAIRALRPGRKAGRSNQIEADALAYERAWVVRNALTDVRSFRKDLKTEAEILEAACEAAIKELQGIDEKDAPDTRAFKKAYKAWAPALAEMDAAGKGS